MSGSQGMGNGLLADQQMSLSIDPLRDTPRAMRAWLARFVAPQPIDVDAMLDLFGPGRNAIDTHSTQVNIIDRRANLAFRTPELPSAEAIANLLRRIEKVAMSPRTTSSVVVISPLRGFFSPTGRTV